MKILVDGFNLSLEKGTGVATYARNLTHNLHTLGHTVGVLYGGRGEPARSPLMREIAFFDDRDSSDVAARIRNAKAALPNPFARNAYAVPMSGSVIARQFASRMPYYDQLFNAADVFRQAPHHFNWFGRRLAVDVPGRFDIAHWTYPLPMAVRGARNVYTMHDLVPLRLPYTTLDIKYRYLELMRRLVKTADHIVTVSETSRTDIIDLLGADPAKVTNTYQAVDIPQKFLDVPVDVLTRELAGTFRLDYQRYLLFYGSIEPKKNIGRIIEAFLAADLDIPLVIVGAQAWKSEQELRLLVDDNVRSLIQTGPETLVKRKVVRLDYVSFQQLVNLIRGARAITFPSLYEGFGLPVVEGMTCGTPVITADAHSTKEIAGHAAILVDPYDVRAIKAAMMAVVTDENLRAEKIAKGAAVAARFSAEAYQQRLAAVYESVMKQ